MLTQRSAEGGPEVGYVFPFAVPQVIAGAASRLAEHVTVGDELLKHDHVTVFPGAGNGTAPFPTVGDEPDTQRLLGEYAVSVYA